MFCNRYGTSLMFLKAYDRYDETRLGKISMSFNGIIHPKRVSRSPLSSAVWPISALPWGYQAWLGHWAPLTRSGAWRAFKSEDSFSMAT